MTVPQSTKSNQDWCTPKELVDIILSLGFPIAFDCTAQDGKCAPGLECIEGLDWLNTVWPLTYLNTQWLFWNPPFKDIKWWVKCAKGWWLGERHCQSVGVAPANIETVWAGEALAAGATLYVLSPRIAFTGGIGTSPPHATMLIVFGDKKENCGKILRYRWKA